MIEIVNPNTQNGVLIAARPANLRKLKTHVPGGHPWSSPPRPPTWLTRKAALPLPQGTMSVVNSRRGHPKIRPAIGGSGESIPALNAFISANYLSSIVFRQGYRYNYSPIGLTAATAFGFYPAVAHTDEEDFDQFMAAWNGGLREQYFGSYLTKIADIAPGGTFIWIDVTP